MIEDHDGVRIPWTVDFPTNELKPWDGSPIDSLWGSLILVLKWLVEFAEQKPIDSSGLPKTPVVPENPDIYARIFDWIRRMFRDLFPATRTPREVPEVVKKVGAQYEVSLERDAEEAETWLLRKAIQLSEAMPKDHKQHQPGEHDALVWLITEFVNEIWKLF